MCFLKKNEVVVGIIRLPCRHIFITQRSGRSHLAGLWEFPGGKIESNETLEQALARELIEEVGITIDYPIFLGTVCSRYSDRTITIHAYLIERWKGCPMGKEGQNSQWVLQSELNISDFPSANCKIIDLLRRFDSPL